MDGTVDTTDRSWNGRIIVRIGRAEPRRGERAAWRL